MCDKYGRPLSEVLALPATDLEWATICFSIDDDMNDPVKRKILLTPISMAEMNPKDARAKMRAEFD